MHFKGKLIWKLKYLGRGFGRRLEYLFEKWKFSRERSWKGGKIVGNLEERFFSVSQSSLVSVVQKNFQSWDF